MRDEEGYTVRLRCTKRETEETVEAVEEKELAQFVMVQEGEWEGKWGEQRMLLLSQLTNS